MTGGMLPVMCGKAVLVRYVAGAFDFPAQTAKYSFPTALTECGLWHATQDQDLNLHVWICSVS